MCFVVVVYPPENQEGLLMCSQARADQPAGHAATVFLLVLARAFIGGYGFDNPVTVFCVGVLLGVCSIFQHWFQEMLVPSKPFSYFTRF